MFQNFKFTNLVLFILVHNSSKEATGLTRKGSKLEAFMAS